MPDKVEVVDTAAALGKTAKKVYNMLNRIAVSGGTYQDWIQTVYTNDYIERSETPITTGDNVTITFTNTSANNPDKNAISIRLKTATGSIDVSIDDISNDHTITNTTIKFASTNIPENAYIIKVSYNKINLEKFPLENLDTMREDILKDTGANREFIIDEEKPLAALAATDLADGTNKPDKPIPKYAQVFSVSVIGFALPCVASTPAVAPTAPAA